MLYMQECRDIIVSLNIETSEKPWKLIKVIPFHSIIFYLSTTKSTTFTPKSLSVWLLCFL